MASTPTTMPSPAHEIAVARIAQDPSLLPALAEKLLGKRPPAARLRPVDSNLRVANPEEIRPDLILARGKRGPWDAVEVQRGIDHDKARRWPLLVGVLHHQRRRMGDLWVLTASRRTATWALTACHARGPNGTRSGLAPVVLLIGADQVDALLDDGRPSLAFFAAWAMQRRHGPAAEQVVERALEVTDLLPDALRRDQERDIVSVLDRRVVEALKEKIMDAKKHIESRWVREMRHELFGHHEADFLARGEAKGKLDAKRDAVLLVLEGRRLRISRTQRAAILECGDLATLDGWLARAGQIASVDELLPPATTVTTVKRSPARPTATAPRMASIKRRPARVG